MKNASTRLYFYLLKKLEDEPLSRRAELCEDLAEFIPNPPFAERLREQARTLRELERESSVLRMTLNPGE